MIDNRNVLGGATRLSPLCGAALVHVVPMRGRSKKRCRGARDITRVDKSVDLPTASSRKIALLFSRGHNRQTTAGLSTSLSTTSEVFADPTPKRFQPRILHDADRDVADPKREWLKLPGCPSRPLCSK
jgi:hypothetical protein